MGYYVRTFFKSKDVILYRVDGDGSVKLWSEGKQWVDAATSYAAIAGAGGSADYDEITEAEAKRIMGEETP